MRDTKKQIARDQSIAPSSTPRPPSRWELMTGDRPPRNLREMIDQAGDSPFGHWLKSWAVLREIERGMAKRRRRHE